MKKTITLSIQEIVGDFERIVRYDEHMENFFDREKANEKEIESFYSFTRRMIEKYIPNYRKHFEKKIDEANYANALKLYEVLYENFREIFYRLV